MNAELHVHPGNHISFARQHVHRRIGLIGDIEHLPAFVFAAGQTFDMHAERLVANGEHERLFRATFLTNHFAPA